MGDKVAIGQVYLSLLDVPLSESFHQHRILIIHSCATNSMQSSQLALLIIKMYLCLIVYPVQPTVQVS